MIVQPTKLFQVIVKLQKLWQVIYTAVPQVIMNFILTSKNRSYLLKPITRIGASPAADIRIHTKTSPPFHAIINVKNQRVILTDHSNGQTFVNGHATQRTYLFSNDLIEFNKKRFIFNVTKTIHIDLTDNSEDMKLVDLTSEEGDTDMIEITYNYNSDSENETSTNNIDLTNEQNNTNVIDLSYNSDSATVIKYIDLTNA